MRDIRDTGIPEFKTLEEEREYWEARGPLAEGHKGKLNKPKAKQKRSSFLAVRLTGEELTRLRDIAAKQGVGPSTYARMVLTKEIQGSGLPEGVTFNEFLNMAESRFLQEDIEKIERIMKDIAIGDMTNPALLIYSGHRKAWEEFASLFLERLLGVKIIPTENKNYEKVIEIIKHEHGKEVIST